MGKDPKYERSDDIAFSRIIPSLMYTDPGLPIGKWLDLTEDDSVHLPESGSPHLANGNDGQKSESTARTVRPKCTPHERGILGLRLPHGLGKATEPRIHTYTEETKEKEKRGTCSEFSSVIPRVDIIVTFFPQT